MSHRLIKVINEFSGNYCFVGVTESGDAVFECDWETEVLSYDTSSKLITGVAVYDSNSYLVAFGDNWLGEFSAGVLDETFMNTGLTRVDQVIRLNSTMYYVLDRENNKLIKAVLPGVATWEYDLPDYASRYEGMILLKEGEGVIVYSNDDNVYAIRDDLSKGTLLNSLSIGSVDAGKTSVVVSNEFAPEYSYVGYRYITGTNLDESSSSSSGV